MTFLIRPERGRLVAGVARGIAEYYQLNTALVRAIFLMAILAAPVCLLVYLLLWISMPGELNVLTELNLRYEDATPRERFERMSGLLMKRTGVTSGKRAIGPQVFAFVLLIAAFVFQMPRIEGMAFYYAHPILSSIFTGIQRYSAAAFYLTVSFAFFAIDRILPAPVEFREDERDVLDLDEGQIRRIGGLGAGLGRTTGVDPAYIRVLFVFLNILTFGLVGALYLLLVWLLKRQGRISTSSESREAHRPQESPHSLPIWIRIVMGFLFLVLALIRITTEFRIFFFNEPFFRGIVLLIVGLVFAGRSLKRVAHGTRERIWMLAGTIILLIGIYDLSTALFQVQLPFTGRFVVTYLIIGLALLYYTLVALQGTRQRYGLALAGLLFLAAIFVQFAVAPARFLMALVQFYDFFFPVVLAGFGLWLVMDR